VGEGPAIPTRHRRRLDWRFIASTITKSLQPLWFLISSALTELGKKPGTEATPRPRLPASLRHDLVVLVHDSYPQISPRPDTQAVAAYGTRRSACEGRTSAAEIDRDFLPIAVLPIGEPR
jgi:hypothetical protein